MLERLLIKQFAIIEQLEIDFRPPFTVLTGETGAGKSILIDAVAILLGGRSSGDMIRHGSEKAYIEGVFSFAAGHPVYQLLSEEGWAETGEESFILSRELNVNGKNPCRVNGCTVSLNAYRQLATGLLDIHGQHEYQQLMQSQKQLDILDAYGASKLAGLRSRVKEAWHTWKAIEEKLAGARENRQAFAAKKEFLRYQIKEIDAARLEEGEEEELAIEVQRLAHSQKILTRLDKAYLVLFDFKDGDSAYDLLSKALQQLRDLGRYDPELGGVYDRLEPASYLMEETAREIQQYKDQFDLSPARLEEAENRLYKIKTLGKKYGEGTEAILKHRHKAAAELAEMDEFLTREEEWSKDEADAKAAYYKLASEISGQRQEIKKRLEEQVDREFLDLAMKSAHFKVDIREQPPGPKGVDTAAFLISANSGEPYLPLAKIASGGELSRITLAMKRILAATDACETLIFDEIDSGIGGATVQAVADKLLSISASQQVICVTHSPVIAAKAGQHLFLEKEEKEGRARTSVKDLQGEERVQDIVRLLSGDMTSDNLKRHAAEMLKR
jgi:DNA repair protein RecN (Recombination protein N)